MRHNIIVLPHYFVPMFHVPHIVDDDFYIEVHSDGTYIVTNDDLLYDFYLVEDHYSLENLFNEKTVFNITSPNSTMYRISTRLSLGSAKSYTQTVNLYNSYGYNGGMYFTFAEKSQYYSVKLVMQVYNTFGIESVSRSAGGLTIGR